MTDERKKFILFVTFLAVLVLGVLIWSLSSYDEEAVNQAYSQPFRKYQMQDVKKVSTYRPSGMRESEIQKRKGRRYETY